LLSLYFIFSNILAGYIQALGGDLYKQSFQFQVVSLFQIIIISGILGAGLLIYSAIRWNRNEKKRELQEFDDASDIKDPKRKRERDNFQFFFKVFRYYVF
jgi:hypothetical protein